MGSQSDTSRRSERTVRPAHGMPMIDAIYMGMVPLELDFVSVEEETKSETVGSEGESSTPGREGSGK